MENFIVSARKYRPITFESVVGQRSITTTLKNAIKTNHLAHAYLFCGPRGVGKTTCARIFAKTINCSRLNDALEPCNECESCLAFNESRSYNIHELDAASNNSVDDIRNLIEQVRIPPQVGTQSVYIIDEVHMLSSAAFNAFLKTLEEPPKHAIFILATTEKHKILPTILSRCQIFDFNRIRVEDIVEHLNYVATKENVQAEPDALTVIAQKADGGMRDALSIFDQIVSFSGSEISYQKVIENLNVLDYSYYFKLVDAFVENQLAASFLIFDKVLNNGFDAHHFISGLSSHFRDLLVCKNPETLQLLEVGAGIREKYKQQSESCTLDFLLKALNITNNCDLNYKMSRNHRLHVELALFQLCNITNEKKKSEEQIKEAEKAEKQKANKDETTKATHENKGNSVERKKTRPKTFSLKDTLAGKTPEKEYNAEVKQTENHVADVEQHYGNKVFTQEEVNKVWSKIAEEKKSSPRLYNTLKVQKPQLKEKFLLQLTLNNDLQKAAVEDTKAEIVHLLKKELQNDKITLHLLVEENKSNAYKAVTAKNKFEILQKQNPKLNKLKDAFDLDLG